MNMDDMKVTELEKLVGADWTLDGSRTIDVGHGMKIRIEYVDNGNEAPYPLQQAIRLDNAIIPAILEWSQAENIQLPTKDEVEFSIHVLPEESSIEGNCSAIDEETDAKCAAWIREELERGNEWAWCAVRVTATFEDETGHDFLGCCSYSSEADFTQEGGYYDDMKEQAFNNLIETIEDNQGRMV